VQAAEQIQTLNRRVAASAAALDASQAETQTAKAESQQLTTDKQALQAKVGLHRRMQHVRSTEVDWMCCSWGQGCKLQVH